MQNCITASLKTAEKTRCVHENFLLYKKRAAGDRTLVICCSFRYNESYLHVKYCKNTLSGDCILQFDPEFRV